MVVAAQRLLQVLPLLVRQIQVVVEVRPIVELLAQAARV
jgi:hypothetical protein